MASPCPPINQPIYNSSPICYHHRARGCSSAGRARQSHCRGQGFEPPHLHLSIKPVRSRITLRIYPLEVAPYDKRTRSESRPRQLKLGKPGPWATPASIGRWRRGAKPLSERSVSIPSSTALLSREYVASLKRE